MTDLTKPVSRVSSGTVFESGKVREVVVTLRPHNVIGFRAKGCKREYQLTISNLYTLAVRAHVADKKRQKKKKVKKWKT